MTGFFSDPQNSVGDPMLNGPAQLRPSMRTSQGVVETFEPHHLNVLADGANTVDLPNFCRSQSVILVDRSYITAQLKRMSEVDPYFSKRNVSGFVEKVAWRFARRISRVLATPWAAPKELIADAIFFHVWSELCTIIPIRRLARAIAAIAKISPVFVILPRIDLQCLKLWSDNELEPFILCWSLQRRGCKTYLYTEANPSGPDPAITLRCRAIRFPYHLGIGSIVLSEGMRGLNVLFGEIERVDATSSDCTSSSVRTPFASVSEYPETSLSMKLQSTMSSDFAPLGQYSISWPQEPVLAYFDHLLGPHFRSLLDRARFLVDNSTIQKAYICDHPFLGSSIFAYTIKERGGSVVLWPHSSSVDAVNTDRDRLYLDEAVVVTQAAKNAWRSKFRGMRIRIRPQIMFPSERVLRDFDSTKPLTVVIFAGAHFLARLPLFRVESHIQTYRRFFTFHRSVAECVHLKFKPKETWEDLDWFHSNFPEFSKTMDIETSPATQLNYPNMIFVTIGYGSTALLEGIACAVPCMVVKEQNFADYIDLSSKVVPIGDAETIWRLIIRSRDQTVYSQMLRAQIDWFRIQTPRNWFNRLWASIFWSSDRDMW
jgi:hypothetical protein